MNREEDVEGAETHEIDDLGTHTSSVASSVLSVSTGKNIKDKAQSVGSGGSDIAEKNVYQSRCRDEVSHATSDRLCQAEAQTRACFLTIAEISMPVT